MSDDQIKIESSKSTRKIKVKERRKCRSTEVPKLKKVRNRMTISKKKRGTQLPGNEVLEEIKKTENYMTDMKNRQCLFCEDIASTATTLRMHMGGKHKEAFKTWCKFCNLQTDDLKNHQKIQNCNEIRCKFCNKRCLNSNRLSDHLRTHCLDMFPMACEMMDRNKNLIENFDDSDDEILSRLKSVQTKVRLKEKIKSDSHKKYLCPFCGKIFKTSAGLGSHMSSHNCDNKDRKRFKCSICDKYLHSASALGTHKKRHKGIMAFVCPICGKGSFDNGAHKKHLEIHEAGPVQCPVCEKQYHRPGLLKIHMRQHTGENQYRCIPCGKSFPVKSMLQSHLIMHKDDRPHECSFCGKGFKDEGTRRKHERIHTGSKPFKCSVCSFRCVQAQGLTVHMKQHPEDAPQANKPHKCLFCYRSFSTNALLMSHNDIGHKNQPTTK